MRAVAGGRAEDGRSARGRAPAPRTEPAPSPNEGPCCPPVERAVFDRLAADGLIRFDEEGVHLTRRWQCAMARAALRLYQAGDRQQDIRVPIALALVELYEAEPDERIARFVRAILPLELDENRRACACRRPSAEQPAPLWFK